MTTYEWISLIGVLICGFWVLTQKLGRIENILVSKVGYKECSEKREKCPCIKELESLKNKIERNEK